METVDCPRPEIQKMHQAIKNPFYIPASQGMTTKCKECKAKNICFFHFPATKLLKITTKWPPGQIKPQKCIFEKSCAIEIDRKKRQ
jgi:hypothetical protein